MRRMTNIHAMAAASRMKIPKSLRDKLVYLAGGQCAICHRMLREFDEVSEKEKYIADTAHIYPVSDRGERGDPARRPANVDDISNLVLLCPYCHRFVDWQGVGGRRWPLDKLRKQKREHEAWWAFQRARPPEEASKGRTEPALTGLEPGTAVTAGGQSYRLPWELRPERVNGTFAEEWSPEGDAIRSQSYAYAETGEASHAWLRRVVTRNRSTVGSTWRRELVDEASLLTGELPRLPGLPDVLSAETTPTQATVITALPSVTSMRDRFGAEETARKEEVRLLLSGLPMLCTALGALHDAGFSHDALDPASILVDQRGNLVLRDLGRATQTRQTSSANKTTDIMALAHTIYECMTGVPPLTGADGPPVLASAYNPAVPRYAATALTRALTGDIHDTRGLARQLQVDNTGRR
jgi:HNH endonuclease